MTDQHDPDLGQTNDALEAGIAIAFGPNSAVLLSSEASGFQGLGLSIPFVRLRDPENTWTPVVRPNSEEMPRSQDPACRYLLHGEIARGGMGCILMGRDVHLGRDVALKVLLGSHAHRAELIHRFVEEAQIAGQLQHPGVVPVYEMGQLSDKRLYFSMKLLKGQTLATLLADRKEPAQGRTRRVTEFLQVCNTLAYAHARGVIHRDLKPANIMIGDFGEVQVMDWGLAKVLPQSGGERDSHNPSAGEGLTTIRTQRTEGSPTPCHAASQTRTGSVLGTPAYMPPEQALGEVDSLDERVDVFGLGAILCEILTCNPPYLGKDFNEIHDRAVRADLGDAFARLDGCGADAELVALCRRCLSPRREDRPRNAGAVAMELSEHLQAVEDRLRKAELARVQAEVKAREEHKRRRVQLALAGAIALLLAIASGGGLYLYRQHEWRLLEQTRRDNELRASIQTTLEKAADLRQQARWAEARALLEQTRDLLADRPPKDLSAAMDRALGEVLLVVELETVRMNQVRQREGKFDEVGTDQGYADVFRLRGLGSVQEDAATVAERVRTSPVRSQVLAALDDWVFAAPAERRAWIMKVARLADPHPWRDRLRNPDIWRDRKKFHALAAEVKPEDLTPQMAVVLGWRLEADRAVSLLRAVQRKHPADFWVNFVLGTRLYDQKQLDATEFLRTALALRPNASAPHNNLGQSLMDRGLFDEAIACYRRAVEIDGNVANIHNNLGNALAAKGKRDDAIASYRRAIALAPRYANAHNNLGVVLAAKGKLDEAIASHQKAIDFYPKHATAHSNLGAVLAARWNMREAIDCYRKAIALDPKYATAHFHLGNAWTVLGQWEDAVASYEKAIELNPKLARFQAALGYALLGTRRYSDARETTVRALSLLPEKHELRATVCLQLQLCDRLLKLEPRLAVFIRGEEMPATTRECLDLALCCRHRQEYAAAARFYAEAFAREEKLASDSRWFRRSSAACCAALAAAKGEGVSQWREQALSWLWADHAMLVQAARKKNPGWVAIARTLNYWRQTPDLAAIRDEAFLKKMPARERAACEKFWAAVSELLRAGGEEKSPPRIAHKKP